MENYFWFSIFVAANSTILFLLAMNVSLLRLKLKISVGDGGDKRMLYAMRAHSNGIEQVPIFGLTILALTLLQTSGTMLAILVLIFTVSRILHGYGMAFKFFIGRRIGAALTYFLQVFGIFVLIHKLFL